MSLGVSSGRTGAEIKLRLGMPFYIGTRTMWMESMCSRGTGISLGTIKAEMGRYEDYTTEVRHACMPCIPVTTPTSLTMM